MNSDSSPKLQNSREDFRFVADLRPTYAPLCFQGVVCSARSYECWERVQNSLLFEKSEKKVKEGSSGFSATSQVRLGGCRSFEFLVEAADLAGEQVDGDALEHGWVYFG